MINAHAVKESKMARSKKTVETFFTLLTLLLIVASIAFPASGFRMIDTEQLHSMMMDNAYRLEGGRACPYTIIDTRTKEDYDRAHIFSAISIPAYDFDNSKNLLPKDKGALLILYGNDRDVTACRQWTGKAGAAGYTNIAIYSEGFMTWKEKGMPVAPL
jgi:rhodanese-related sulfurtransferase